MQSISASCLVSAAGPPRSLIPSRPWSWVILRAVVVAALALSWFPRITAEPLFPSPVQLFEQSAGPIAGGDFDGGGYDDLIIADGSSGHTRLFLLRGGVEIPTGLLSTIDEIFDYSVPCLSTADFDRDGRLDFVYDGIVYLGRGDGSFRISSYPGYSSIDCAVTDLDGDGALDLVSTSFYPSGLLYQLGHGDGTFAAPVYVNDDGRGQGFVAGDLDGDGRADLVISVGSNYDLLRTYLSRPGEEFAVVDSPLPQSVKVYDLYAIADIDEDGRADLLVGGSPYGTEFLPGRGDGSFADPVPAAPGYEPGRPPILRDLDGDGRADLLLRLGSPATIRVFLAQGGGSFREAAPSGLTGGGHFGLLADLDGDGSLDLVTGNLNWVFVSASG
jgi:FG-GAP-like repeat